MSQEKLNTMLTQTFWEQTRFIMGDVQKANEYVWEPVPHHDT